MNLNSLCRWFSRPAPKLVHSRHSGRQHRALHNLIALGTITQADIGGNSPSKVIERLRHKGYLHPEGHPRGHRWETNPRTGCDYKVYLWTGKLPPEWVAPERMRAGRGGKA